MSAQELLEITNFMKRASDKSTLSQIILPFCSDTTGKRSPVALLSGNINLKTNLRKDGVIVPFEEELKRLEAQISDLKSAKGQIIDLSEEMKRLQIENDGSEEKEIEIKEEWTEEDEALIRIRRERKVDHQVHVETNRTAFKTLPNDIEELLRLAEMEEEDLETLKPVRESKVQEIKKNVTDQSTKKITKNINEISKLKLPKITSSNPLVGDIIERKPEPVHKPSAVTADEVSTRIILNDLKKSDLKSAAFEEDEIIDEKERIVSKEPLKKSSLFSLRKQQ